MWLTSRPSASGAAGNGRLPGIFCRRVAHSFYLTIPRTLSSAGWVRRSVVATKTSTNSLGASYAYRECGSAGGGGGFGGGERTGAEHDAGHPERRAGIAARSSRARERSS